MAKIKTEWICTNAGCGKTYPNYKALCPNCKQAGTIEERTVTNGSEPKTIALKKVNNRVSKVFNIKDVSEDDTTRIKTGMIELDRVLGGGIVPGSVTAIGGEPGAGKCLRGDTRVVTPAGIYEIQELITNSDEKGFKEHNIEILGASNEFVSTTHQFVTEVEDTLKITSHYGYSITGTYTHPVLILNNGKKEWKNLKDIQVGDYIAVNRKPIRIDKSLAELFPVDFNLHELKHLFPATLNAETAYIWGILIGDGGLTRDNEVILTSIDHEVKIAWVDWVQNLGGSISTQGKHGYRFASTAFVRWLNSNSVTKNRSEDKKIPDAIFKSPTYVIRQFLSGLFDTDGSALPNGNIEYCTSSKELAKDVQYLLLLFGIVTRIRQKATTHLDTYILTLYGDNARLFYDNIGFRILRKQERMIELSLNPNPNIDVLPSFPKLNTDITTLEFTVVERRSLRRYMSGKRRAGYNSLQVFYDRLPELKEIIDDDYFWDEITEVVNDSPQICYDFTIPNGHSFTTNGIVSHNSTLLTQLAILLSHRMKVLYIAAEENLGQIKVRVNRLINNDEQIGNFFAVFENMTEDIENHLRDVQPDLIVIDSLHTIGSSTIEGQVGRQRQTDYASHWITQYAKSTNIPAILIAQVTKGGDVAGSNAIQHLVDAVMYLEGEDGNRFRFLRNQKNRNADANSVGVFEMTARGLNEVPNPSETFLQERQVNASGSGVAVIMDGMRPIITEVQALAVEGNGGNPRRNTIGFNRDNLMKIVAVMQKFLRYIDFSLDDIFINVTGGLTIEKTDKTADLSVAAALVSSSIDEPIPAEIVPLAEVGLSGELRRVQNLEQRIKECELMGFTKVVIPPLRKTDTHLTELSTKVKLIECKDIEDAMRAIFYNVNFDEMTVIQSEEDDE